MGRLSEDKLLLKSYLDEDNLESLYVLVFEKNGKALKQIIVKMTGINDESSIMEYMLDFYDDLTRPTENGEKKLRNFDFTRDLTPYLKQSLRSHIYDRLRLAQKRLNLESSIEEEYVKNPEEENLEDYSEKYQILLKSLYNCDNISDRDQYIMLTYLLCKIGNPGIRDSELNKTLGRQLGGDKDETIKKARQRAIKKLIKNLDNKF